MLSTHHNWHRSLQVFQLAPIKTASAALVIDVIDAKNKLKRGSAYVPLNDIQSQEVEKKMCQVILVPGSNLKDATERHVIHVQVQFQFSKVLPLKRELYRVFEEKRAVEVDITSLSLGRECATDWEWEGL